MAKRAACAVIVGCTAGPISSRAQSPTGPFDHIKLLPLYAVRVAPEGLRPRPISRDLDISERLRLEYRPIVEFADGRSLEVPLHLPFLLSKASIALALDRR